MAFMDRLKQIGGGVVGLLGDEGGALTGLQQNPAFQMGVGLLDPRASISEGVLGGLQRARGAQTSEEDRKRMEEYREALKKLIEAQTAQASAPIDPATGQPNTATEQALQMSLIPGMPGSGMNVPGEPTLMPQQGGMGMGGFGGAAPGSETERLLRQMGWQGYLPQRQ